MLGDLKAQGEIKSPTQLQRPAQIMLVEQGRGDLQRRAGNPGTVDPTNIGHAVLTEGGQPQAGGRSRRPTDAPGPETSRSAQARRSPRIVLFPRQVLRRTRLRREPPAPRGFPGAVRSAHGIRPSLRGRRDPSAGLVPTAMSGLAMVALPVAPTPSSAALSERKCDRAMRRRGHGAVFSHRLTVGASRIAGENCRASWPG